MCGIGGILFSGGKSHSIPLRLSRIAAAQQHRGPDGRSQKLWDDHGLCHQRLALLDVDGGAQPFTDLSGRYTIVYNGEVYNYRELKTQLQHIYPFSTHCDTEVVLVAYIHWGASCVHHFDGMFSFLIWDAYTQTAFAARDAMGVKPFVYTRQGDEFLFASELKALLQAMDHHPALNDPAIAEYILAPYLSGDALAVHQQIHYLQPGHYMHIQRETVNSSCWYQFQWQPSANSETMLAAAAEAALKQSVQQSLQADSPVGIFFSGGLDSSFIGALAAKTSIEPVPAYTICFEQHDKIHFDASSIVNSNDLPYAIALAELLHLPLQQVEIQHQSLAHSLNLLSVINDRIPAWEQEFSQHFLSRAAAGDVKAVLVGDAADETNYGYFFLLNERVNYSPVGLLHHFGLNSRLQLLSPRLQQQQPAAHLEAQYRALATAAGYDFDKGGEESMLAMSTLVHQRWLQRLLHNGDIHTMHFGLEARVPFANRCMLDVINKVYPSAGFREGQEKNIIRKAAMNWLGAPYYNRKKSALPRDPRQGAAYQHILHDLLQEKNEFIDCYLNRKALEALCLLPEITENSRMQLFNMISLVNWGKHYAR